jgi:hypothetical protein
VLVFEQPADPGAPHLASEMWASTGLPAAGAAATGRSTKGSTDRTAPAGTSIYVELEAAEFEELKG